MDVVYSDCRRYSVTICKPATCCLHALYILHACCMHTTCTTCILHIYYMCAARRTYIPHVYHMCHTYYMCGAHIVHVLHAQYTCVAYTPYLCYLCCITTWVVHTCYTYTTCVLHAYYHATLLHSKYGQSGGHNIEKNLDTQYSTVFFTFKNNKTPTMKPTRKVLTLQQ